MYIYILTNKSNTVLYIGVTNNIMRRTFEHEMKTNNGFAEKYNANKLVYYERCNDPKDAIEREKQLKKWRREKKEALINAFNPDWHNLLDDMLE